MAQPHPAKSLLERAHSPTFAQELFIDAVVRKPLVLRPTTLEDNGDARKARQRLREVKKREHERRKRKPQPLSARKKRILGLYEIPKDQQKFEIFEPLHHLWLAYIHGILDIENRKNRGLYLDPNSAGPLLAGADFHGAEVEVARCRCTGRVGIKGIVAKDTRGTFEIITRENELKGKNARAILSIQVLTTMSSCPKGIYDIQVRNSHCSNRQPAGIGIERQITVCTQSDIRNQRFAVHGETV
jgi:ribonuclease P protein subunit POP4